MTIGQYSFTNEAGQDVWFISGCACQPRPVLNDVRMLVLHDTDAPSNPPDSRAYLQHNDRPVSTHYLVGEYADVVDANNPTGLRVYKYASEGRDDTYCEGFGTIGGYPGNPNAYSISIEIEAGPTGPTPNVVRAAARLARCVLDYWHTQGKDLLVVAHKHIDSAKSDPRTDWTGLMEMIYGAQ